MAFIDYLENFEKRFEDSLKEDETGSKFSQPQSEIKNPVKTNMKGQKPKGASDKAKSVKKVNSEIKNPVKDGMAGQKPKGASDKINKSKKIKPEIKNPVKTNMAGKKPSTGNMKYKNPNPEMGGGVKNGMAGQKPKGSSSKFKSPSPEIKNPVKSNMGLKNESMASKAAYILDGVKTDEVIIEDRKNEKKSNSIASKAASLL